jgi:hypothetical protein
MFGLQRINQIARNTELKVPGDPKRRMRWRHKVEKSINKVNLGKSVKAFRHTEANTWLNPHSRIFKESDSIAGCTLRFENYPCKTDMKYRHRNQTAETVGHVSGYCYKIKDYRIKRQYNPELSPVENRTRPLILQYHGEK